MLRATPAALRWQMVMYHRDALPLKKGRMWHGKWGAMSIRYGRSLVSEKMSGKTLPTMVDRQVLNYMHVSKARNQQIYYSYSRKGPSQYRARIRGSELRRRMDRKIKASFIHFMQFKVMKNLEMRAELTSKYGQAAVNKALGDPALMAAEAKERKWSGIRRKVTAVPTLATAPRYQATMKQIIADRFENRVLMR